MASTVSHKQTRLMASSPQKSTTSEASNSPVPFTTHFSGDELSLIFGTYLDDLIFVCDWHGGALLAGNGRFLRFVGKENEAILADELGWEAVIHPEDRSVFHTWKDSVGVDFPVHLQESFDVRMLGAEGREIPFSVTLKHMRWKQGDYLLAFAKERTKQLEKERHLVERIEEQKSRALAAIKSSLCVYQLNERIKSTPVLTTRLLDVENEEDLFSEAVAVLTSEQGLNYKHVTFYTLDEEARILRTVSSTKDGQREISLDDDDPIAQLVESDSKFVDLEDDGILFPLKSRGRTMGICEVLSYPRERFFFDETGRVGEWQKDVVRTVGDIIALLLDNLRLTRETKRQSNTDTLTGAYNRHYFSGRLAAEIQRAGRYGRPVSMLFIDVDKFKQVNDNHGHLVGDQVLRDLGKLFVENLRQTDVVCRYGGDEFVALLPEASDEMAVEAARKLRDSIRSHAFVHPDAPDRPIPVSVSIGLSTLRPGEDENAFLKSADDALYAAKQRGRDCLVTRDF